MFNKKVKLYLGADHNGFKLKEELKKYLLKIKVDFIDLGNNELNLKDDYPYFAERVGRVIGEFGGLGILICGTGIGMCIAANKIKGVRAASVWNTTIARLAREHNHANILCLAGNYLTINEAKKIVKTWLEAKESQAKRHVRRINY